MSQPLRIEDPDSYFFITLRTANSRLWFVNNQPLHHRMCAFLARYQEMFEVEIYGFIIMGNHIHLIARFPRANKAAFMQAFAAIVAKLVATHVPQFPGGRLWAKRYAEQVLYDPGALMRKLLYLALNPISSGLVKKLTQYTGYNSIFDTLDGTQRRFQYFARSEFNEAERRGHDPKRENYLSIHTLKYSRLPGFERMTNADYLAMMKNELKHGRQEAIAKRREDGKSFAGPEILVGIRPGALPRSSKSSTRDSFYPLVFCDCPILRQKWLSWYFSVRDDYLQASARYRAGEITVEFPPGTYRPRCSVPLLQQMH